MVYAGGMPEVNDAYTSCAHAGARSGSDSNTSLRSKPSGRVRRSSGAIDPHDSSRSAGVSNWNAIPVTILADTGERLDGIGESQALAIARRFLDTPNNPDVRYARFVTEPDQWTLTQRQHLPFHKVLAEDSSATELYISSRLGDVVVHTTRRTRALAWISAIPHWLYFTTLRANDRLWRQLVLWVAGLASLSALLGLVLAFAQFSVPYRGWLRWHYRAGAAFGVFALTWTFSGLLSMEPWFWARAAVQNAPTEAVASALAGGELDLSDFPEMDASHWSEVLRDGQVREVEFLRIQGEPHLAARSPAPMCVSFAPAARVERREPFSVDSLIARVKTAIAGSAIVDARLLDQPDVVLLLAHRSATSGAAGEAR